MKKILIGLSFFLVAAAQHSLLGNYVIKSEFINNAVVFLSIIFGFYITSFAIFVTSKFVAGLYKQTDQNNKSLSLLHTLIYSFRFGLIFILITILYLMFFELLMNQRLSNSISLSEPIAFPFLTLLLFNFAYSYKTLNDLSNIIIQSAKKNSID